MLDTKTILAAVGYALLTGLFNLIFSRKTQIEAWCAANPRLAAIGMFMRSVGFDPHNLWAFVTLFVTKKLPAIKLPTSAVVQTELQKIGAKKSTNDTVSIGPLLVLLFLAFAVHQQGCAVPKPPCDESKLRAIDEDYAAKVLAVCLPKYDSKEACPEWPALQVEHRRQLQEACP